MNEESQIVPHQGQKLARIGLDCLPAVRLRLMPLVCAPSYLLAASRNSSTSRSGGSPKSLL